MREWLRRGALGEEPFLTFSREMDIAEAHGESRHVLTIANASKDDWRAAAFILKTKYKKRWGENEPNDQPAPTEVNITVTGTRSASSAGSDPNE
jgi:hypothetical protein